MRRRVLKFYGISLQVSLTFQFEQHGEHSTVTRRHVSCYKHTSAVRILEQINLSLCFN
jgi:hypothetical protein